MFILNPKHKRRTSSKHRRQQRRKKVCYMRAKRKVIRYHNKRIGWMGLVKRLGVRGAKKVWRRARKMLTGR